MEERKKRVLNAIIQDYIANAEPVGSRTITKKYDLGVSPATIRNEMSDLEDEGYIEQPHTSAGRIPSVKGYRFFVDHLMERERLTAQQQQQIRQALGGELLEMDQFMRSCCNMISRLTNYAAIAAVPERGRGRVENVQLVAAGERQVLVIILASTGIVRHKLAELPLPLAPGETEGMELALRQLLIGRELRLFGHEQLRELLRELQLRERRLSQGRDLLEQVSSPEGGRRIFTSGVTNMLSQPEFRDVDKLKNLFSLLEEESRVQELLSAVGPEGGDLTVTIGGEVPVEDMHDCTVVVANYFVDGENAGSIGVLGPTRMSYGRTISLMEQVAAELGRVLSDKKK